MSAVREYLLLYIPLDVYWREILTFFQKLTYIPPGVYERILAFLKWYLTYKRGLGFLLATCANFDVYFYFYLVIREGLKLRWLDRLEKIKLDELNSFQNNCWSDLFSQNFFYNDANLRLKKRLLSTTFFTGLNGPFLIERNKSINKYKNLVIQLKQLQHSNVDNCIKYINAGQLEQLHLMFKIDSANREFIWTQRKLEETGLELIANESLYKLARENGFPIQQFFSDTNLTLTSKKIDFISNFTHFSIKNYPKQKNYYD